VIRGKLRAWLGITSPSRQLLEQVDAERRQLHAEIEAYAKGFEAAQLLAGDDPAAPLAADLRHKSAAAHYINRLFEISNPSIGKRRNA
jgi:hypothetical protein